MKRREFITLLGGAAAWPLTARAQQPAKVSRIGFVAGGGRPPSLESSLYAGFAEGMRELGYIEGKHFIIDYRLPRDTTGAFAQSLPSLRASGSISSLSELPLRCLPCGKPIRYADRAGLLD